MAAATARAASDEGGVYRCYTRGVPTIRRRHAITETPRVQGALDELRRELGTDDIAVSELVVLGAQQMLAGLRSERHRQTELVTRLAERVRTGSLPVDPSLADEVRHGGWVRD